MKPTLIMQSTFIAIILATIVMASQFSHPQLSGNPQPADRAWCQLYPNLPGCQLPPMLTGELLVYHDSLREVAWYTDKHGVNQIALLEVN